MSRWRESTLASVRDVLDWLTQTFFGPPEPPILQEVTFERDVNGRPDLRLFTKSAEYYAALVDEYLASLSADAYSAERGQWGPQRVGLLRSHAYQRGVVGQWGLIARGPGEALPYVLALLTHKSPEACRAAAAVFDAWAGNDDRSLSSHVLVAAQREASADDPDPESLTALLSALAGTSRPRDCRFSSRYCARHGRASATSTRLRPKRLAATPVSLFGEPGRATPQTRGCARRDSEGARTFVKALPSVLR